MSVIARAIADRHSEIERLQAEIKALNDVDKMLGISASAKPAAPRSSSRRPAVAATTAAETASDATPTRKRRPMTAKEKKAVSERMKAHWPSAERQPRSSPSPGSDSYAAAAGPRRLRRCTGPPHHVQPRPPLAPRTTQVYPIATSGPVTQYAGLADETRSHTTTFTLDRRVDAASHR